MAADQWWYSKGDKKLGPVTSADLKAMATDGRLLATDLIWREGMKEWTPAGRAKSLFPTAGVEPPPLPTEASPERETPPATPAVAVPRAKSRPPEQAAGSLPPWLRTHLLPAAIALAVGTVICVVTRTGNESPSRGRSTDTGAAWTGGNSYSNAAGVERVLRQDSKTADGAATVADVVRRMRSIDLAGCPGDFQAAYVAHTQAWEHLALVELQAAQFVAQNDEVGMVVESFIRGFLGDPFGKAQEVEAAQNYLQQQAYAATVEIKQTYERVEQIAAAYGAKLPR